ncbi:MAG: orotate phosphoribosyltransferase [Fimbriimonadaceae bacterium]|nr:orotate phosphoribosyltransferase [Fimbriimonadaceae bacterium]
MLRGHFVLSSGRHSDVYLEKFRVLERPDVLSLLCSRITDWARPFSPELVAGPTTGGVIIAFEVARQLGVPAVYVESENGRKCLRRGARIATGARVLVVDDVLTTGLSVQETCAVIEESGGIKVGVAVLIDRAESSMNLGVPLFAAHRIEAHSFAPDDLPESLAAIPATKPGTRTSA